MKKILSLTFSALLLFCSLSIFAGCNALQYPQYETLEIEKSEDGTAFIAYKGNRYFYNVAIETNHYPQKYGLYINEKQLVGKIYYGIFFPVSLIYVSDLDKDANVLYVQQGSMFSPSGCWLKEGVVLPDMYTASIDNIIISLGDADEIHGLMDESVCVPTLTPNTTYYDIVDQSSLTQLDTKGVEVAIHGYLGIKGYEYLKVQYLAIFEVENEICIAESRIGLVDVVEYYKVKPEYQESFRNAINELNNT